MSEKSNAFRVFIDSNVIISAIRSTNSVSGKFLNLVLEKHHLLSTLDFKYMSVEIVCSKIR